MDRTTKLLLAAIAIGLWANLVAPLFGRAAAQDYGLLSMAASNVAAIANGTCVNRKICGY